MATKSYGDKPKRAKAKKKKKPTLEEISLELGYHPSQQKKAKKEVIY